MHSSEKIEIFLVAPPGMEAVLCAEAHEKGFCNPKPLPGGVQFQGDWRDVWRANLQIRGAARVLARIGSFRAFHLAQLDKRSRKFNWASVLRADEPVRVEVTCKRSKIYHDRAAAQRIETAIHEALGTTISKDADICVKARIDDNLCTFSVDTSGEALHRRGHKQAVGKAPMRENLAALFLRQLSFDGTQTVVDPMCGSGTFVIEAAEIAAGLNPGRSRSFAFEKLASFDASSWQAMRNEATTRSHTVKFYGSDRNAAAVAMASANAERSGVAGITDFQQMAVSDLVEPEGPAGLVIVNPPYGARIGNKKLLYALYGALGKTLLSRFSGWRVGVITSEASLAKATGLPFLPPGPPVAHGSLKIRMFSTNPLP